MHNLKCLDVKWWSSPPDCIFGGEGQHYWKKGPFTTNHNLGMIQQSKRIPLLKDTACPPPHRLQRKSSFTHFLVYLLTWGSQNAPTTTHFQGAISRLNATSVAFASSPTIPKNRQNCPWLVNNAKWKKAILEVQVCNIWTNQRRNSNIKWLHFRTQNLPLIHITPLWLPCELHCPTHPNSNTASSFS